MNRAGFADSFRRYTAALLTVRAVLMYFSINIGESDNTSPMLSKP